MLPIIFLLSAIQIVSIVFIIIGIIRANKEVNRSSGKFQIQLNIIKWSLLSMTLICLIVESEMHAVFKYRHHYNGNFLIYCLVIIVSYAGFLIFDSKKNGHPILNLTFSGMSFIITLATAVYFGEMIYLALFPFFGVLIIIPFLLTLYFFYEMIWMAKNINLGIELSPATKIVLTLVLGGLSLFIIQLILNQTSNNQWHLLNIFFNNGSFGMIDPFYFD